MPLLVIPAEAGIQFIWRVLKQLNSDFHRSYGLFICLYVSCPLSSNSNCLDVMILKRG